MIHTNLFTLVNLSNPQIHLEGKIPFIIKALLSFFSSGIEGSLRNTPHNPSRINTGVPPTCPPFPKALQV
jgi:hypothetical protein